MTIPKILHQTWKTDRIPENFLAWSKSWEKHNPGWRHILWSDRMLLDFVAEHYPQYLPTYCSYWVITHPPCDVVHSLTPWGYGTH